VCAPSAPPREGWPGACVTQPRSVGAKNRGGRRVDGDTLELVVLGVARRVVPGRAQLDHERHVARTTGADATELHLGGCAGDRRGGVQVDAAGNRHVDLAPVRRLAGRHVPALDGDRHADRQGVARDVAGVGERHGRGLRPTRDQLARGHGARGGELELAGVGVDADRRLRAVVRGDAAAAQSEGNTRDRGCGSDGGDDPTTGEELGGHGSVPFLRPRPRLGRTLVDEHTCMHRLIWCRAAPPEGARHLFTILHLVSNRVNDLLQKSQIQELIEVTLPFVAKASRMNLLPLPLFYTRSSRQSAR
jgi:hypothetical protein